MKHLSAKLVGAAFIASLAGEAAATEWNVSVWGKRRAFTEHVEKLAELVSASSLFSFWSVFHFGP